MLKKVFLAGLSAALIIGGGITPLSAQASSSLTVTRVKREVRVPAALSSMPKGNLPGWEQVYAEDFTKAAPAGSFAKTYPNILDYGDTARDTSKKGVYNNSKTLSAHDGVADVHFQTLNGTPSSAVMVPGGWEGQTYGRYSLRYRADRAVGYKAAIMLWPSSDNWSEGEVDYPEGDFDGSQSGFVHEVGPNPARNAYTFAGARNWDWHTATIDWSKGLLVFYMDGQEIGRTTATDAVPTTPHRWVIQIETSLSGTTPSSSQGHFLVDWATYYKKS